METGGVLARIVPTPTRKFQQKPFADEELMSIAGLGRQGAPTLSV